ncbi:MAG: hypothetical protein IH609_18810 [Dehalococcoidia bacterium]|nr:hypothetical protein [Dehalococcoidia bacterium]
MSIVASASSPADKTFVAIVLAALLISQAAAVALGFWHPDGNLVPYIEAHRDSWWAWHTYSGMAFVVSAGAYTAIMWWLVPDRGRVLAVAGGLLTSCAVASFGAGLVAEASTHWYAGSPTLSGPESHDLLTYIDDSSGHLVGPILVGLGLGVAGPIISGIGLGLSRTLAWWAIALFVVGSVAGTVFGPASILSLVAYAFFGWRVRTAASHAGRPEAPLETVSAISSH